VSPEIGPRAARSHPGERRQSLLEVLRGSDRPLDASEAGRMVGLHRNSARAHLDALVAAGLAKRRVERRSTRGRPRVLYELSTEAVPGHPRSKSNLGYVGLAQMLAGQLTQMEDATNEAVRAGRRWAAALDSSPLAPGELSPVESMRAVAGLFDKLGFDSELILDEKRILLHHCPFLEVARAARPVVCGTHLGILKATLERLDAPLEVTGFHPLVEDDPPLCVVTFATTA